MKLRDRFALAWRALTGQGFRVNQTPPAWVDRLVGGSTAAGVAVGPENALTFSAVWACTRILAETLASVPLVLYEQSGQSKRRAREHSLYRLLHDEPNGEMSSYELRETLMGHLATWGNAYAEIEFDRRGAITALWPLRPDRMTVERVNGALAYQYRLAQPDGQGRTSVPLAAEQVWHLRGLGFDGRVGYSPVRLAMQSIGLGLAAEEYGARFYGNGARPGGVLEHPGKLSDAAYKRLLESFEKRHQGLENASRLAVLEEGMKYQQVGIPPEEAQFLQTRTYQVREIARWYRIPPHMLADLDRATFSNIEHLSLEFVQYTMLPWFVRWEQSANRVLLLEREKGRYFARFVLDGLLRGDTASRYQAYAVARQNGWLSANDIREMEDMNPVAGGEVYLVPLNMIPADQVGAGLPDSGAAADRRATEGATECTCAPPVEEERGASRQAVSVRERRRYVEAYRPLYDDVAARVIRREVQDIGAMAKRGRRDLGSFVLDMQAYYAEDHREFVVRQFAPTANGLGTLVAGAAQQETGQAREMTDEVQAWIALYLSEFAARHCDISAARLRRAMEQAIAAGEDSVAAIEAELAHWQAQRAAETARWEVVRFASALAKAVYVVGGVRYIRWVASGENCPYCNQLNGQVVGIQRFFLEPGEFQPDGAERPLRVTGHVGHAPAHDGCNCTVVSA